MNNKFLNFQCKQCNGTVSKWTRLPPNEIHKYRVTCSHCGRFVGWGTEPQLLQLVHVHQPIATAVAVVQPPGATLDDWF